MAGSKKSYFSITFGCLATPVNDAMRNALKKHSRETMGFGFGFGFGSGLGLGSGSGSVGPTSVGQAD